MGLRTTTVCDRIQELGLQGVSPLELLTVMMTREERDVESNEVSVKRAFQNHTVAMFKDLSYEEFRAVGGLERYESTRLLAALELGRRAGAASAGPSPDPVTKSQEAYEVFKDIADQKQEHFCAAFFDSKAKLIGRKVVHIGTLNVSVVGAREVFREAVRNNAASVIVAHNHPSGDPEPSPEDLKVTKALVQAGQLLDIPVLDHLVIGSQGNYVSFNDRGLV
jgi:DNA repair protein RadC